MVANTSGLIPTEFMVVVEMDATPDRIGAILMPTTVADRDKLAADEGTLIAVSPLAFTYEKWPEDARKPEPGDRVVFRKYAGLLRKNDANGKDYRLLNDKDIVAIVDAPAEEAKAAVFDQNKLAALRSIGRLTDGQGSFADERVKGI